ncbi:MAG: cardiolipin synthase ClsB [Cytophagales bacterium]|nr:cardiolipin synthase ClsB [Rhizobacter sp.]
MSAKARWKSGNRLRLLENGEEFFPAVFEAIAAAEREVLIETFILFEDKVGLALHEAVLKAARRGVQVDLTVDGFGSPDLSPHFISALTEAGVRIHVFDPQAPLMGMRINVFRRMHRKIVVVDGVLAFVGGINYSADHLADFGPQAKQDYAVEVSGPIVDEIHRFALEAVAPQVARKPRDWFRRRSVEAPAALESVRSGEVRLGEVHSGEAEAMFVTRDNHEHRNDIERHYRVALRTARREVIIANAYFFPGYLFLKELRRAARRGVQVRLILQGEPDMPVVKVAASMLYGHLQRAGVQIYEYCKRPLHGKVALIDDEWSTVGSSNLDPLSLALNLEANLVIRDRAFNQHLRERLEDLIENCCKEVPTPTGRNHSWSRIALSWLVFHFLRRFPAWAGWLPAHQPVLKHSGRKETTAPDEASRAGADHISEHGPRQLS